MKLLLADDEIITRKGIYNNMDWKSLGITEIYEVEDGQEGIEILDRFEPNVLLTDIRMPFVNGIELAIETTERYPDCKIIFLSGFSDKEYLKAAIHLGVVNYIEKPIDLEELHRTIQKAIEMYHNEKQYLEPDELKKMLVEKMIRVKGDILFSRPAFKKLNLDFKEFSSYYVLIIRPNLKGNEYCDILKTIKKIMVKYFGLSHVIGVEKDHQNIVWIIENEEANFIEKIKTFRKSLLEEHPEIDRQLFYAIGNEAKGLEKIYQSYQAAVINLQMLFWEGYGKMAFSGPVINSSETVTFEKLLVEFKKRILTDTEKEIVEWLKLQFMSFKFNKHTMSNDVKNYVFQMTIKLYETEYMEPKIIKEEREEPYLWEHIFKMETLDDLYKDFLTKLTLFFRNKEHNNKYSQSIRKVMEIIDTQYMRLDLSTKELAQEVFLTTSYLSSLFKQETGETVSKYIQKVRVEKSKKLLEEMQLSLVEVAEKVGYRDANYYAKVFKKIYGCTPSDYKERL